MTKIQQLRNDIAQVSETLRELNLKYDELAKKSENPGTPESPNVECNHSSIVSKLVCLHADIKMKNEELESLQDELTIAFMQNARAIIADKQKEIDDLKSSNLHFMNKDEETGKRNEELLKQVEQWKRITYDHQKKMENPMAVVQLAVRLMEKLDEWMHDDGHFESLSEAANTTRGIYNTIVDCLNDKELRYNMPCHIPDNREGGDTEGLTD